MTAATTTSDVSTSSSQRRESIPVVRWIYPSMRGESTAINDAVVLLGRTSTANHPLSTTGISRRHAEITTVEHGYFIADCGSRNGTFVNGRRITVEPLADGDLVRLGGCIGQFQGCAQSASSNSPYWRELVDGLFGGPILAKALESLERAARSTLCPVLEGEIGTGKIRVARAMHGWSARRGKFIPLDCAVAGVRSDVSFLEPLRDLGLALPGAPTDHVAVGDCSDHGHANTIYLANIGDLDLALQISLCRVLAQQVDKKTAVIGGGRTQIIIGTNEPLEEAVRDGRLRPELHAYLKGASFRLPPLRERREDIPHLTTRILRNALRTDLPALDGGFVDGLCNHDWSYNEQELETVLRRIVVTHGHQRRLTARMLPSSLVRSSPSYANDATEHASVLDLKSRADSEVGRAITYLRESNGNMAEAAKQLGINRARLYRILNSVPGFDLREFRKKFKLTGRRH